jgi:hypothetical protein
MNSLENPAEREFRSTEEIAAPSGEVRFLPRAETTRLRGALEAARLLFVDLPEIGPGARGKLAEAIDDAVEQALRQRGGAPPGICANADADASLSDQLYRARKLGRVGFAIALGPLVSLTDAQSALVPEDGAALRFLCEATRDRPVVLLLDDANLAVRAYGAPEPLREALGLDPAKPEPAKPPPSSKREPRVYVTIERVDPAPAPVQLGEAAKKLGEIKRTTPLSKFETAFVEAYVPLHTALIDDRLSGSGIGAREARALCAQFRSTFTRAYAEALPTFGVTGRHPRMIFELFDLAQRCARVHGARSTHVVIVDALRFDLARRVRDRMAQRLARQAVCVEEHALWSILPTTTAVQLDALVRGEDALRAPARPEREAASGERSDAVIVRGRSLDVLRRMRLGHRDVVKLDLLEARLRDAGSAEKTRLDSLADELTPILSRYVATSTSRALVVVAGDHGFTFQDGWHDEKSEEKSHDERGPTPPARQGGASPDEVFVPFHAWLVGGVH